MAEETILLDVKIDQGAALKSIDDLTKANKELRKERNAINTQTEEGQRRIQAINKQIDKNTDLIKANVSALEKQKINIGNYRSALEGVNPAFGRLADGLEKGTSGFKAMTLQALRFIATPIGAIIAALVAVFTTLKAAISTNNQIFDKFENVTNAVGIVVDIITTRIGKLGEALVALSEGRFSDSIDIASKAFSGLADEIQNAVRQGQLYLDLSRELEDSQRSLRVETARQENEIKRLVTAAKNRNLTFEQQEALINQALKKEEELVKKRSENARKDLVLTAKQIALRKGLNQTEEETFEQFTQRLLEGGILADEEVDSIIEKIEALENARGSSLAFQEKLENTLAGIHEKRNAALEKQNKALEENAIRERDARIAKLERQQEQPRAENPIDDAFQTQAKMETDLTKLMADQLIQRKKDLDTYWAKRNADAQKNADMEIAVERAKVQVISNAVGTLARLANEDTAAHKVLASAQALMNTYLAATAALASGSEINPVFGIVSAAAAIAQGLAAVAQINGVQFAEGGYTGPGSKYQPAGIVHAGEYVAPQSVVNSPAARPHISALESMRTGKRSFADGGFVSEQMISPYQMAMITANAIKSMPPPVVGVREFNRVSDRINIRENISKI